MSEIQFFTKGENYMNYTNTGFLETDIEFAKDLEKALQEHEIHFSEYDALNGKTATFSLDDVEGFIGKDLEEIAATFYEEKMSLKGQIDFYGDENGRYAIHNSPLHSYTQDEAILMDATVSELLEELNRRNSEIFLLEPEKMVSRSMVSFSNLMKKHIVKWRKHTICISIWSFQISVLENNLLISRRFSIVWNGASHHTHHLRKSSNRTRIFPGLSFCSF